MTPERWRRIADLYHAAAAHDASERSAFLRAACAGDEALLRDVESLAADGWSAGGFLEVPPLAGLLDPLAARSRAPTDSPPSPAAVDNGHPTAAFLPGELVKHRFRIVREVAHGGMAVVYEAIDEKLDQRIAIKRPLPGFWRHLPPEVRNALRVTHPNVCRTFEIHEVKTQRGDEDFLTMEFLDGETLAERLGRDGPPDEDAAREIALQICAGLEEAHARGVIHGDLKSRNVILATGGSRVRVVITDFGLATRVPIAAVGPAGSAEKKVAPSGTPGYMAPELWAGTPTSVSSDIYALGVVLEELVTGRRPAGSERVSDDDRTSQSQFRSGGAAINPTTWHREIQRCLEPQPERRFRSVRDLRRALQRVQSLRWSRLAAAILLTLIASNAFSYDPAWRSPTPAARLALADFESEPELRDLAATVRQDVARRLANLPGSARVRVLPASTLVAQRVETPAQAKAAAGATHLLSASFRRNGDRVVVAATIADTTTQLIVGELVAQYGAGELVNLPRAIAGATTSALGLSGVAPESLAAGAGAAYAQAMTDLRADDGQIDAAVSQFAAAIDQDPMSALPLAGLAASQLRKFELTREASWKSRARDSIDRARARNPDAAPVHLAAAMLAHLEGNYDEAVRELQRGIELQPANADLHRRQGRVYESMNRPEEALVFYRKAVAAEPAYYKPYIDLGVFHYQHAQYADAAAAFRTVTELAPDVALGHTNLGSTYANLGRYDEAEAEYRTVLRLRANQEALENLAGLLAYENRDAEAVELYQRALAIPPQHYRLWMNIGDSYRRTGRADEARDAYRRGQAMAEQELRQEPRSGYARAFAAYFYGRLGDRARALLEIDQALRLSPRDARVLRRGALLYDALGQRDNVFRVLATAPPTVIEELSRHPDLVELTRDARFQALKTDAASRP